MSPVASDLAATSALDDNAAKVDVGSFYADRRAVIVLIRYFDSASGRKIVTRLRDAQSEIERRGGEAGELPKLPELLGALRKT